MSINIKFVDSCRDISDDLWSSCFAPNVEGLFWYQTLEDCGLEEQFKIAYGIVADGEKQIGIAPCFLHDMPMSLVAPPIVAPVFEAAAKIVPAAGYQRTLFIGSPCSDEGTIGLLPQYKLDDVIEPLARACMQRAAKLKAVILVFKDCPQAVWPALEKLCGSQKFFRAISYPGAFMTLPGSSIDDYYAALKRSRRHNFKKKLRRSREELDLETTSLQHPGDELLTELFPLFMQTYEKGKTKFEKLSIEFFKKMREKEEAWFLLQRDRKTGRMVTFMLLFKLGDTMINKFIGLDYSYGGNSFLYFRQFEEALKLAYAQQCKYFQSGQTGYRAKLDLGHTLIPLQNYCRHLNPLVNLLYSHLAKDITWQTLDEDLVGQTLGNESDEKEGGASGDSA